MELTMQDALNNIASSIAQEQAALADLLKEEANKVQKFVDLGVDEAKLLEVNESVNKMLEEVNKLENILQEKLSLITAFIV